MPTEQRSTPAVAIRHPGAATDRPATVVLADNHPGMRRSLRLLLDGEADLTVVGEAADLLAVMRQLDHHRPQVLVLDLGMHNGTSLEAIRRVGHRAPDVGIVALTMEESPAFARRALDAGAAGFVLKDRASSELPDAVRRVARHFSPA